MLANKSRPKRVPGKAFTGFSGDLGNAKQSVRSIATATNSMNQTEAVRQVFLQLEREMKRLGLSNFAYSDITIVKP